METWMNIRAEAYTLQNSAISLTIWIIFLMDLFSFFHNPLLQRVCCMLCFGCIDLYFRNNKIEQRQTMMAFSQVSVVIIITLLLHGLFIPAITHTPSPSGILPDITYTIGNTPLVDLSRVLAKHYGLKKGRILGKCEYLSCGASKKDRIAKQIILDAIANNDLQPGQQVVELTSGNTGTVRGKKEMLNIRYLLLMKC
jgi:hypothetical protein